jgi:hypothetical protein
MAMDYQPLHIPAEHQQTPVAPATIQQPTAILDTEDTERLMAVANRAVQIQRVLNAGKRKSNLELKGV